MASTLPPRVSLEDKYLAPQGPVFMTGVQALARVILDGLRVDERAGLDTAAFVSGYRARRWARWTWSSPGRAGCPGRSGSPTSPR